MSNNVSFCKILKSQAVLEQYILVVVKKFTSEAQLWLCVVLQVTNHVLLLASKLVWHEV